MLIAFVFTIAKFYSEKKICRANVFFFNISNTRRVLENTYSSKRRKNNGFLHNSEFPNCLNRNKSGKSGKNLFFDVH